MGRPKTRLTDRRIEPLRRQLEQWRGTHPKRRALPEPLWQQAVALAQEHGVYAASRALRLSYESLRRRAEAEGSSSSGAKCSELTRATFVELGASRVSVAPSSEGAVVEVTGSSGQRLTVRLRGGELDVAQLLWACWSGQPCSS